MIKKPVSVSTPTGLFFPG